jgi:aryl-alcohol dehydrogenase
VGVLEGASNPPVFLPQLVELYQSGELPLDKISKTFDLKDFEAARQAMLSGEVFHSITLTNPAVLC